jgi:hypothetical protein
MVINPSGFFHAFSEATVKVLVDLACRLEPLSRKTSHLSLPPSGARASGRRWFFRCELDQAEACRRDYLTWAADGLLRHTVYVGLREDKPSRDVRRDPRRDQVA